MTIKNLYPKSRPQSIYNVINGRPELPAASTFSRASEATYVDANGIIQTAAVDEPRFNYDPNTGEFLGLLLENEGENLNQFSSDAEAYSLANPLAWVPIASELNQLDPLGGTGAAKLTVDLSNYSYWRTISSPANMKSNTEYWVSVFVKQSDGGSDTVGLQFDQNNFSGPRSFFYYTFSTNELLTEGGTTTFLDQVVQKYSDGWVRLGVKIKSGSLTTGNPRFVCLCRPENEAAGIQTYLVYGWSVVENNGNLGSYVPVYNGDTPSAAREPDAFSLTSSSNFDGGFSLLLDSETDTDDYFYKIKASGTTIAELNNASGTLDWVINGVSAAINGEYPQVGAIQPGRVRTISSFGAADGTTQQNYLYTEGLSFPTNAIVASGADEVEFGPGQTLKAVYLWNGQLSNTEAVSVIKGEYNIVPNEPIKADSYSFVYNTDPTTVGEATITLPYIVPTVSMRVYWGDGTNSAYEQGVTPSHTYPYPGQYRIQIEADDGFDSVRLGDIDNSITLVDQWAPQHRVDASGPGFTGDDLVSILISQNAVSIPDFKYTDITNVGGAFRNNKPLKAQGPDNAAPWSWVPTELLSATSLNSFFTTCFYGNADTAQWEATRSIFPQLQTSDKLTSLSSTLQNNYLTGFKTKDGATTYQPFTNTSKVTNFDFCFTRLKTPTIVVDTQSATSLNSTFFGMDAIFGTFPFIQTGNVQNFPSTWNVCKNITGFPLIDTSKGTNFSSAWKDCSSLTSFPQINTSSGITFSNAWNGCTNLTSFPQINTSSGTAFQGAWLNCSGLTSFPLIDTSNGTDFGSAWQGCSSFTSFPLLDTSSGANFYAAWYNCDKLTSFPLINTATGTAFSSSWSFCSGLTSFPAIDTSSGTNFYKAWQYCTNMTDFPANMFDTTGTLKNNAFGSTWLNCALTAQSIENILVSLDTNGQSNIELSIDGGTNAAKSTWTAAANTAYTNLINKGWTITFNP